MPWTLIALLVVAVGTLVVKAVIDRRARYDEPMNDWDGRFDHMVEPGIPRDRELQERQR